MVTINSKYSYISHAFLRLDNCLKLKKAEFETHPFSNHRHVIIIIIICKVVQFCTNYFE